MTDLERACDDLILWKKKMDAAGSPWSSDFLKVYARIEAAMAALQKPPSGITPEQAKMGLRSKSYLWTNPDAE